MALAALVNFPFLFNNLVYFISERFFPKTREIGSFVVRPREMTKNRETRGRTVRVSRSGCVFAIRQRTQLASLALFCSQTTPKAELWKLNSFIEQECKEIYLPFDFGSISINQVSPRERRRKRGMGIATARIPKPLPLSNPTTPTQDGTQLSRKQTTISMQDVSQYVPEPIFTFFAVFGAECAILISSLVQEGR